MSDIQKSTIGLWVSNISGVLVRIGGVFSRRGHNIDSLNVATALDSKFAHMTITCKGPKDGLAQIIKQLDKLVDVIWVKDYSNSQECREAGRVIRESALIRLCADATNRNDLCLVFDTFRAQVVHMDDKTMTIHVNGDSSKIDKLESLIAASHNIIDAVRSGLMVLPEIKE